LVYGILVLLDALGTKANSNQGLEEKVKNFDLVDDRFKRDVDILVANLRKHGYNSLISSGTIYDNFQIFLPIDNPNPKFADHTGKNNWYWSLVHIGQLLIDVFRYALSNNIPLWGCITSGYGERSKTNRILGPIADEASKYYELTNWIGIIVTKHPELILNYKASVSPNPELFDLYIRYKVPVRRLIFDNAMNCYKVEYGSNDFWALSWPTHKGYQAIGTDDLIYVSASNNTTEYGNIVPDDIIIDVLTKGVKNTEDTSKKWQNTWTFFNWVNRQHN
jgi:hypothetical protein